MPVTDNGQAGGKLLGIVTERDYRLSRMSLDTKVSEFMTPRENLVVATEGTSLKEANDIIWDHKLNSLPIVDANDNLCYLVFRQDYDTHKENPLRAARQREALPGWRGHQLPRLRRACSRSGRGWRRRAVHRLFRGLF